MCFAPPGIPRAQPHFFNASWRDSGARRFLPDRLPQEAVEDVEHRALVARREAEEGAGGNRALLVAELVHRGVARPQPGGLLVPAALLRSIEFLHFLGRGFQPALDPRQIFFKWQVFGCDPTRLEPCETDVAGASESDQVGGNQRGRLLVWNSSYQPATRKIAKPAAAARQTP